MLKGDYKSAEEFFKKAEEILDKLTSSSAEQKIGKESPKIFIEKKKEEKKDKDILEEAFKRSIRDKLIDVLIDVVDCPIDRQEVVYHHDNKTITYTFKIQRDELDIELVDKIEKHLLSNNTLDHIQVKLKLETEVREEFLALCDLTIVYGQTNTYRFVREIEYRSPVPGEYTLHVNLHLVSIEYLYDDC